MKMKELTTKKNDELKKLLAEKQEALRQFRFKVAGAQVREIREGRKLRRVIARIKTILNNQSEQK